MNRTTLEVSKETRELVRLYCVCTNKKSREFVDMVLNQKLRTFKKGIRRLKLVEVK